MGQSVLYEDVLQLRQKAIWLVAGSIYITDRAVAIIRGSVINFSVGQ